MLNTYRRLIAKKGLQGQNENTHQSRICRFSLISSTDRSVVGDNWVFGFWTKYCCCCLGYGHGSLWFRGTRSLEDEKLEFHKADKNYSASRHTDSRSFEVIGPCTVEMEYLNLDKVKDSSCFLNMIYMCLTS